VSLGKGHKNSGNLQKKIVQNAQFFIIWRFPFPDAHIHEIKKPNVCRSPRVVKDGVAQSFDVLVLAFGRVLMLLMRLTLPSGDV
jgi:hypothetical protein